MSQHIVISKKERVFDWVNTVIMLLVIILTLYPFWYVIVASVSSISHVTNSVVLLWPDGLHWDAYQQVFRNNLVPTAYANTIFITLMGTVISMLLTCASAFVLSRKELPGRRLMTLFVVFTMLFNAGLVPFYLLVRDVGLLNTRWSLILPFAVSTYNTIIMRNFFQGVPNALYEAASIDGCSYFKYFLRILLPISLPSIATITLTFFHEVYTSIRQRIGVIMCSISKDRLFRLLQNVEGMMVTNAQDILYTWDGAKHPMPEQLQAGAWFENNAYYIAQPLERLGLTLLICTELQPLRAQALYNALVNMAAISFVGLLLLAVSHIQVRKMLSHLEQTRKAVIDLPEDADLSSRLPDTWNDEAGELAAAFKRLNSRVNEYYHRLLQEEKDKRHAQQIALQYQLNPHFLFNSLYWLQLQLENRDMDDTLSDAIAQLGQVLHYNLEEQLTATLMEEKQMAQAYVSFMSSMKGSEISLDIDLPQSLRCSTVPRFTLQPLLENAIQHGFVKGAPLHLHVSFQAKHGGSALHITVANDGKPIPPDRLAQLNAYLQQPAEDHPAGGVGLRNIKRRLVLFYGETVSMTVASDVQNTQVTITLPASKEQQKETIR